MGCFHCVCACTHCKSFVVSFVIIQLHKEFAKQGTVTTTVSKNYIYYYMTIFDNDVVVFRYQNSHENTKFLLKSNQFQQRFIAFFFLFFKSLLFFMTFRNQSIIVTITTIFVVVFV